MLHWSFSYLGQEQTQGPRLSPLPSQQVYYPPSPASKSHYRASTVPGSGAAPQAAPVPPPGPGPHRTAAPPSPGPAHLALHLHGAQAAAARPVPVAAVHAEAGLRGGLPAGPTPGSAGRECAVGGLRTRQRPGGLLTGTCRGAAAARVSAQRSARLTPHTATPRVGLAKRRAGTRLSLRASAAAATAEEEAEGAEQRRQAPQPRSRPPPPRARARAPGAGGSRGACARSPAASVEDSADRAPPTPNRKRAPAPEAPANRHPSRTDLGRAPS